MNHNKEARDELQAFVDVIKTIRKVRHKKEIECHLENLVADLRPLIKDSKAVYFQAVGKWSSNCRKAAECLSSSVLLDN